MRMNMFLVTAIFFAVGVWAGIKIAADEIRTVITAETFSKATALCEKHGGKLEKVYAYFDKDVMYCGDMKIIAKKDDAQGMWASFEIVKADKFSK